MDIRPGIHAVSEANPTERPFDHYSGVYSKKKNPKGYEENICPQANVLPLSRERADIDAALDGMKNKAAGASTWAPWGWRALSPGWQDHWQGASATPAGLRPDRRDQGHGPADPRQEHQQEVQRRPRGGRGD